MIRKRLLCTVLVLSLGLGLVGCSMGKDSKEDNKAAVSELKKGNKKEDSKYVIFVSDVGSIDDKSFNEGSWKGVRDFADSNGYECDFIRPAVDTEESRSEAVDKAVEAGADVLVCVGSLFEKVVYDKQNEYKDVEIVFIDGEPKKENGDVEFNKNVHSILFKEEESGYLAGYAAVKDGYRNLAFLGGMEIKAVISFGFGFVQGAEAAAKELGIKDVKINYHYTGVFAPTDKITSLVDKWYKEGTEIIFSCGGGILYSVIEASENGKNRKIIGVDVDQAAESDNIVFSAMKGLTTSIKNALEVYEKNDMKWPAEYAGKTSKVGVKEDGVGLSNSESSWRLENMTLEQYEDMISKMKEKDLNIKTDKLPELKHVKVNMVK